MQQLFIIEYYDKVFYYLTGIYLTVNRVGEEKINIKESQRNW